MIGLSDDQGVSKLVRTHGDLDVYKKAFSASLSIHKASLDFPKIEQYALADQIRRCSKSICANLAEGFAKQQSSRPEFKRYLLMAIGSAHETLVWAEYCQSLGYINSATAEEWLSEYRSIARMLQSLYSHT